MQKPAALWATASGLPVLGLLAVSSLVATLLIVLPVNVSADVDACRVSKLAVARSTWSAAAWTSVENRHRGTTDWHLDISKRTRGIIEGFAGEISVAPQDPITLFVKAGQRWRWKAYRLGYYGGAGARLYGSSCWYPPSPQPAAVTSGVTRTATAPWKPTLTIQASWPPGLYLLKLINIEGRERYIPLVVHSPSVRGRTVYMFSAMTMQAYNRWGGRSLYVGPNRKATTRSLAVSFDRPFDIHLARQMLTFEQPLVAEAERLGIPLAYLTDIEVAIHPRVLSGARTLMTDGHDEYWTFGEQQAVIHARDHGTNLLFLGANQLWWQVRLGDTSLGRNRLVICYKAAPDPIARTHPQLRTTHFRSLAKAVPESRLVGVQYSGLGADAPFVVYQPNFFAFAHTGAHRGSAYPGLVGQEIDTVNRAASPANLEIVGRSAARCYNRLCISDSVYYTVPSGAAVWAAGTDGWINALGSDSFKLGVTQATRVFVRIVTDNLLRDFARGPAGRAHPAKPNVTRADSPPATPTNVLGPDVD